uniref:ORF131 n=1 Tax=Leptospirillum ferrooxidans TaxID=180 RepID=Q58KD6_9BACT|nr:ORF131 [Leptospirillum ferrooxidans]
MSTFDVRGLNLKLPNRLTFCQATGKTPFYIFGGMGNISLFGIFAALAEFERALVSERTKVGLASARARGRNGGGQYKMTPAKLRLAMAAMGQKETVVNELCKELGVTRQTLYRHLGPDGVLRQDGQKLLER